jgi:preprotein translocase subunit SecE
LKLGPQARSWPNNQVKRQDAIMAKTNPLQFIQQVRSEVSKVVWPNRREVVLTTIMVFIMAALTATFFSLVDLGIRTALSQVINALG